jgi:PIN domain nuclease of toxin-antitoxin system
MNVLLDTCALLALSRGVLPQGAAKALRTAPEAWVSAVTAWEVAIKAAVGKLRLPEPPARWLHALSTRHQLRELSLDAVTACAAAGLPLVHRDPFDRVLVAIAHAHALTILTCDQVIPKYPGIQTLW